MQVVKNKNIPLILQLVKASLTYESDATVKFKIYDSDFNVEVSEKEAEWNGTLNTHLYTLSPSTEWTTQEMGNYLIVWSISDTDLFVSTMIEEIVVVGDTDTDFEDSSTRFNTVDTSLDTITTNTESISANIDDAQVKLDTITTNTESISANIDDAQVKLDRILGLNHENCIIDNPVYDKWDNLQSARMRIYSDSVSVGTDNNIIGEYTITADTYNMGKFNTWKQVKN